MNHLFSNVTWLSYTEMLTSALAVYYLFVLLRWYRTDIAKFLRGDRPAAGAAGQENLPSMAGNLQAVEGMYAQTELSESLPDAEMLTMALLAAIAERSSQPYDPQITAERLKTIICRCPGLGNSPQRTAINSLIAAECKKTGIARLSEQEVDTWWDG